MLAIIIDVTELEAVKAAAEETARKLGTIRKGKSLALAKRGISTLG